MGALALDRLVADYAREDGFRRRRAIMREVVLALPAEFTLVIDCMVGGNMTWLPADCVDAALEYFADYDPPTPRR